MLSEDEISGKVEAKKVIHAFSKHTTLVVSLHLSNGETLEATGDHPFYVQGKGWTPARECGVGTSIITRAGPSVQVTGLRVVDKPQVVYNLKVDEGHSYFVGNSEAWVHNANYENAPRLRRAIKALSSGEDVTVKSFREADEVLYGAFSDARKFPGSGLRPPEKMSLLKKAFALDSTRRPVFHKDYLHNPADANGSLFGHESLPVGHEHKTVPHINILNSEGDKLTVYIVP